MSFYSPLACRVSAERYATLFSFIWNYTFPVTVLMEPLLSLTFGYLWHWFKKSFLDWIWFVIWTPYIRCPCLFQDLGNFQLFHLAGSQSLSFSCLEIPIMRIVRHLMVPHILHRLYLFCFCLCYLKSLVPLRWDILIFIWCILLIQHSQFISLTKDFIVKISIGFFIIYF